MSNQFGKISEATLKLGMLMLEELVYGNKQATRLAGLTVLIRFAKSCHLLSEDSQNALLKAMVPLVSILVLYNFTGVEAKPGQDEIKKLMNSYLKSHLNMYGIEYLNTLVEKLRLVDKKLFPQDSEEIKLHNKSITDTIEFISNKCMNEKSVVEKEGLFNRFIVQLINLRRSASDSNSFVDKRLVKLVTDKTRVADQSEDISLTLVQFVLSELESNSVDETNESFRDLLEELMNIRPELVIQSLASSEKLNNPASLATLSRLTGTMVK